MARSLSLWKNYSKRKNYRTYEFPLFTDARFTGEISEGLGPYQIINVIADHGFVYGVPSAILRISFNETKYIPNFDKTNTDDYHGGEIEDEIAAFLSLELGIRIKAGPYNRTFDKKGDPWGRPFSINFHTGNPNLEIVDRERILNLSGERSLSELPKFKSLCSMSEESYRYLLKSARLYQEAVWVTNVDPNLSWLLLVSAIETAANFWRKTTETNVERMEISRPELRKILLEYGDEALVTKVADQIAPYMGSTKKFIDYLIEFLPGHPEVRPPESFRLNWSKSKLKDSFSKIYNFRSKALHEGTPFPWPMSSSPHRLESDLFAEIPLGLAASSKGGIWLANDMPMLLNTFHYIARGALLNWWDSLASSA